MIVSYRYISQVEYSPGVYLPNICVKDVQRLLDDIAVLQTKLPNFFEQQPSLD